jgi:8-oxo-dGTP diphosphatase
MGRVVSGVLVRGDGHILMGKRKSGKFRGDLWELPGGKLEDGEDPVDALQREWLEELDCHILIRQFVASATLDLEVAFVIDLYHVELASDSAPPQALDHSDVRYVDPWQAVKKWPCSPAFYMHWPWLRSFLGISHLR